MRFCDKIDTCPFLTSLNNINLHTFRMSGTPLSPYNPYLLEAPKNESLQMVISEKGNAFRAFDWNDYVITVSVTRWSCTYNADPASDRPHRIFEALLEFIRI